MKFLIILLLIVLIISLVVLYPKENFFSRGPKLVEKNTTVKLKNKNSGKFTLSLAIPIPMGNSRLIQLGSNIFLKTNLSNTNLPNTKLELSLMNNKVSLATIEKEYKSSEIIDNIINTKLYNLAVVYNSMRVQIFFEDKYVQVHLDENLQSVFRNINSFTYLFTGGVYEYEFSNIARDQGYLCTQNNSCNLSCTFMSKNFNKDMGDSPQMCYDICNSQASCSETQCHSICIDPNTRLWKPLDARCKYKEAFGKSKEECLKNCVKMGPNCSKLECLEKCNNCTDSSLCEWVKEDSNDIVSFVTKDTIEPPDVKVQQFDGGVILSWDIPDDEHIKAFLISYFPIQEEQEMGRHMRVVKADKNKKTIDSKNTEQYEETISNLDENKFYTFEVRSYSDKDELSDKSNAIVIKPQKYNTELPREDIDIETLPDYFKFCNV